MGIFLIFVFILFAVYILLLNLKTKSRRLAASFALYSVRDKFVLLVAEGVISESDPVFSNYYSRINAILSAAPNIGLDHMIKSLLKSSSEDLEKSIKAAKENAKKLNNSKSMEIPEVKDAVRAYFDASREMILSHSNVLKLLYLASKNSTDFAKLMSNFAPKNYVKASNVVSNYNDIEISCLAM